MIFYIGWALSLFEKWSPKYDFGYMYSFELLLSLCFFSLVIVVFFLKRGGIKEKLFVMLFFILSLLSLLVNSELDVYNYTINLINCIGGVSLFLIMYQMVPTRERERGFIKVNYCIMFLSFLLYLYAKFVFFDNQLFGMLNKHGTFKYPFYSSASYTLTFSEPSFAGCYLLVVWVLSMRVYSGYTHKILLSWFIFLGLVFLSGSKIALIIYILLSLIYLQFKVTKSLVLIKYIIILYIPTMVIVGFVISLFELEPSFIGLLPGTVQESFYTRFFFIFSRFDYLDNFIFGFGFNGNSGNVLYSIVERINEYSFDKSSEALGELNSYRTNALNLVPKDYFSFLIYNLGVGVLLILFFFQKWLLSFIKSHDVDIHSFMFVLSSLLFVTLSINLTSVSIIMVSVAFWRCCKNHYG